MRILIAALAGLILATPSSAADYRPGPYAGLSIGYSTGALTHNNGDLSTDGVPVSGIVGYTFQLPATNFVLGIEGEATWSNVKGTQGPSAFSIEASTDYALALKGRAGMVFGPALLYATAGGVWTRSKIEWIGLSDKNSDIGLIVGGGVDLQITNTVAMRLEAVRQMTTGQEWTLGATSQTLDAGETTLKLGVIVNLN